jgi:hypothetical protein
VRTDVANKVYPGCAWVIHRLHGAKEGKL